MASQEKTHFSLIDAGVSNIWSLSLSNRLESLNLHGNYIRHISNLSHLVNLVHLDLSANQISVIDGLEKLTSLKTLNLSCNVIASVSGLSSLRSLETLNLSYNQIEDVSGLKCFSGPAYHLGYLALHGNKLRSIKDVILAVGEIKSLHNMVLRQEGSGNPLCHIQGYEQDFWSNLPQLETLNGLDKSGKLARNLESVASIPGLEAYLDFLLSSSQDQQSQESGSSMPVLTTPKIDAVIEQFKQKLAQSQDSSSTAGFSPVDSFSPMPHSSQRAKGQISSDKRYSSPVRDTRPGSSDTVETTSSSPTGSLHDHRARPGRQTSKDKVSTNKKTVTKRQTPKGVPGKYSDARSRHHPGTAAATTHAGDSTMSAQREVTDLRDMRGREEAENVYKNLMTTLETERERRWKAEQATRRLADVLKSLQAKGQESDAMKMAAMEATGHLKTAVMNEHEANLRLKEDLRKMQINVEELRRELEETRKNEERSRDALRQAEVTLTRKESEEMSQRIHQKTQLQEAQQRASAMTREVQVLRHSLEATKQQLQQVQETLADRERAHREEISSRYTINSPELQQVISEKVKAVERSFQSELNKQQEKVEQLSKQYTELENEFRYALQVEETRLREIKNEHERVCSENMENKQLLLAAQRREEASTSMVTELSALVKEQKGRLSELVKSKHEQATTYKERIESLEEALEHARKQGAQVEILKQNKSKLQATIQAQESVIEGLKAERKLWGQELAQQGASLSQDRGRLESKIETLSAEVVSLKKQLEREGDAVKIKTKILEDQTETIRKLKEALVDRDETIRSTRDENLKLQRSYEEQLNEQRTTLEETRDLLDRTSARKDELKQQVASLQHELQETKETYSSVSARWKEKSELIGRLEQQVTRMKETWTQKEAQLVRDRDSALEQAKQAIEQLKSADNAFRQQLELKEAAYQEKITGLELEKQREIDLANQKVAVVEEEMRDLLRETESNKRAMENKVKKLNQALGDLQTDLM